jgi:hypothetical protein
MDCRVMKVRTDTALRREQRLSGGTPIAGLDIVLSPGVRPTFLRLEYS